jgi:hypothetical protein
MEWLNRANAIYVDQGIPGLLKQYGPKFRDYVTSEGGLLTDLHRMGADMGKEYGDLIEGRGATPGVLFDIATASGPVGVGMGMMRRAGKEGVEEAIQQAAKKSGIDEDAFANLARQGHMTPQVAPVGAAGKEIGFPTGYSKGLKRPVGLLRDLDAGLTTVVPEGAAKQRGLVADIEAMEGKVLVPMPGDRTSRDVITSVMGEDIDPYQVHGGYDYMPDVGGWASGKGVISRYDKLFKGLEGRGVGVATPMAGTGSDYSHAAIDVMYRSMDVDAIPPRTKSAIKKEVNQWISSAHDKELKSFQKAKAKAEKEGQEFTKKPPRKPAAFKGLTDDGKGQLYESGLYRKAFMESIDKDRVSKLPGAPQSIALRHAITDDRFRFLTRGDPNPLSGQRFMSVSGETDPTPVGMLNTYQHPTYDTHLAGEDLGGLAVPAPRTVLFPDFAQKMERQGRPLSQHNYMFDRMKPRQELRPDVIEGILKFEEKIRSGG